MFWSLNYNMEGLWVIRPSSPSPHKSFNKLNLLLVKVQSLWSCAHDAHYFQWFTGYLNHVDLLMSHVHIFKETTQLFNVHLSIFVDFILCAIDKYMFKINNKINRLICWMCSKLKINTAWHRSSVFIVFIQIDHVFHVILLAVFIRNGTATCNCLIDVLSKWLFKTWIRRWGTVFMVIMC